MVGHVYAAPLLIGNLELKTKCPLDMGTVRVRIFLDPLAKKYVLESFHIKEEERKKLKGKTVTIIIH